MNNDKVSVKSVIMFSGAILAFLIGSGFATGQEVLQYFAGFGFFGIAGAFLTLILLAYVCASFLMVGQRNHFEKGGDIYSYYCGKYVGKFFDYFSVLFCFLSFTVMIGGAGATLNEHYGLPVSVGGIIMGVLAIITVIMGLDKIVNVLGKLGPIIVAIAILLGIFSIVKNFSSLSPEIVNPAVEKLASEGKLITVSSSWISVVFSYVGFCMLWLASFLGIMGTKAQSQKEARLGGIGGGVAFSIGVMVVALGLMGCIHIVAGTEIPMLQIAKDITPYFGTLFAVIIMAGIYTTSVPLLYNVSGRFTEDGSKQFKISTIILAIVGVIIGLYLPFSKLINIIYGINGYVGAILLIIMIIRSVINIFKKIKSKDQSNIEKI
ncbi:YkvI family membrane protein [Clostridium fallax]|uniref:Uncharacterized membrane protein YkvI n=1 Tax=Clostridium fallax TaxID=1533 RepID=A0A1M4XFL2_9CLOT|nr:hypothetical protein [Clostridium fallax]SHE92258.1 Uncharacterized membrane protein YkvI [Clostridium fallax]SQB06420.1 membrane protein [Clostridium fallax]